MRRARVYSKIEYCDLPGFRVLSQSLARRLPRFSVGPRHPPPSLSPRVHLDAPTTRPRGRFAAALAVLAAVLTFGACQRSPEQVADGDDPVAALGASTESHRYTEGYWQEQMRADATGRPSPWRHALAYCGEGGQPRPGLEADGAKPNCFPIFQVESRSPAADARRRARTKAAVDAIQRTTDSIVRANHLKGF